MSAEATIGVFSLLKWVGGGLVTILTGFIGKVLWKDHTKLQETLTKTETEHLIDLKVDPVKDFYEAKHQALLQGFENASKERNETNVLLKEVSTKLSTLHTKVEVMGNEVSNIKERLNGVEDQLKGK